MPLKAQVGDFREVVLAEAFVGAFPADVVHLAAAPRSRILLQRAVGLLDDVLFAPHVCDFVGVGAVCVAGNLVAVGKRVFDKLAELRFASELRLYGEHLRIAAVVPALVPAHEADFSLVYALTLQLAHDVAYPVECDNNLHFGLVFEGLVDYLRRRGLPALTHPDFGRINAVFERGPFLDFFGQRPYRARFKLVFAVGARHARIVCVAAFKLDVVNENVGVGFEVLEVEENGLAVRVSLFDVLRRKEIRH